MNDAPPGPDDKQFHGWRLLGIIGIIVASVGVASLLIAWFVIG